MHARHWMIPFVLLIAPGITQGQKPNTQEVPQPAEGTPADPGVPVVNATAGSAPVARPADGHTVASNRGRNDDPPSVRGDREGGVADASPRLITYQGRLLDGGVPASGAYDVLFSWYTDSSGTGSLSSDCQTAAVVDGLFTVVLSPPIGAVERNTDLWLELSVGPDGPGCAASTVLTPRQRVTHSMFAIRARDGVGSTGVLTVTGTISSCCTDNATAGCDDASCEAAVCAFDSFCCTDQWDHLCADEAVQSSGCSVCRGLVGVGTPAPTVPLEVHGTTELTTSNNTGILMLGGFFEENLSFDADEIQARSSGLASTLHLNPAGGNIVLGSNTIYVDEIFHRIGVNTSGPTVRLEVQGGTELGLADNTGYVMFGTDFGANLAFDTNEIQARDNAAAADLLLNPAGGNVGIGTASTSARLHVVSATGNTGRFESSAGGTAGATLWSENTNTTNGIAVAALNNSTDTTLFLQNSGTGDLIKAFSPGIEPCCPVFRVTTDGSVGVGITTSPTAPMHIRGADPVGVFDGQLRIEGNDTTGGADTGAGISFAGHDGNGPRDWGTIRTLKATSTVGQTASNMTFSTRPTGGSPTERMRIDYNGRVGMGRIPVLNALEVEGNASKTASGSWLANSDGRIKTSIEQVSLALDKIDAVRLVTFNYTDEYRKEHPSIENRRYANVIAQEFQEVFPDDVRSSGEPLPGGGDDILQVDTYPLTIYSAAAIQELHALVKTQQRQITALQEENRQIAQLREEKDREIRDLVARLGTIERMAAELAAAQKAGE